MAVFVSEHAIPKAENLVLQNLLIVFVQDILAGEEITTTYVDPLLSTAVRRPLLKEGW